MQEKIQSETYTRVWDMLSMCYGGELNEVALKQNRLIDWL